MKIAVIQFNAKANKQANVARALQFVKKAVRAKAQWILLPEVFNYRGPVDKDILLHKVAETIPGESVRPFQTLARQHKVFILLGSLCEKVKGKSKIYNTSVLLDPKGKIVRKYRKMNLFDAVIGKTAIKESKIFFSGKKTAIAQVNGFKVGLSICYDVRFPELYRTYSRQGCQVITVPASFTKKTGQAHWEALLRARAIENLCYVVAPNQTGKDGKGVPIYGNSMIISPWGDILARGSDRREEIIYAQLNHASLREARRVLPAIK